MSIPGYSPGPDVLLLWVWMSSESSFMMHDDNEGEVEVDFILYLSIRRHK